MALSPQAVALSPQAMALSPQAVVLSPQAVALSPQAVALPPRRQGLGWVWRLMKAGSMLSVFLAARKRREQQRRILGSRLTVTERTCGCPQPPPHPHP